MAKSRAPTATGGAGHLRVLARTGAVTLIQRFGGSLNLNIHFHVLMLDGVYVTLPAAEPQESESSPVACIAGFSLHAGVAAEAHQRDKVRSHSDREGALGYSVIHPLFDRLILQPSACIPELPPTTGQTRFFCFNSEGARYFGYIVYSTYPRGSGLPVGFRVKIHGKKAID